MRDRLAARHPDFARSGRPLARDSSGVGVAEWVKIVVLCAGGSITWATLTSRGRQMRQSAIDTGPSTSQVKHRFSEIPRIPHVAKSDLGTKRICPTTGKKFYDLNKSPVISPYTGEVVTIAPVAPPRAARGDAARAARRPPLRPPPLPMRRRPRRPKSWCRSRRPMPRKIPARSRP